MKLLFELFPLLVFFAAYKLSSIYTATAAAIGAALIQALGYRLRGRPMPPPARVALFGLLLFGGLTLLAQDAVFIKWKPTIVYWVLAALLLGSQVRRGRTAAEFVLGERLRLPSSVWRRVNLSWGLFFLLLGIANLYVAFFYAQDLDEAARTDIWVNIKVFGLTGVTFAFSIAQALYLARHIQPEQPREDR